jgi:nucleoside-diphosphate-sugar epimerase
MTSDTNNNKDDKPIVGVIGATGMQGSGLVQAILNDGDAAPFRVRAFTRDPTKASHTVHCIIGSHLI